jgi:hypothetical protein
VQVPLEPFALEVEARAVLAEELLVAEQVDAGLERPDRDVGGKLDGGAEQAAADEGDAVLVCT